MTSSLIESREFYREFFAEEADLTYDNRQRYEIVYSLITDLPLERDVRVLDAGAGSGRITRFLHERFGSVTSVDIVIAPLLREAVEALDTTPIEGALPDLPFGDEVFDLVVCSEVLEHIPDRDAQMEAVRELRRVVTEGGYVVISTPNPRSPYHRSKEFVREVGRRLGVVAVTGDSGQYVENWIPPSRLRRAVESAFRLLERRGSYYAIADFGTGWKRNIHSFSDVITELNIAPSYGLYQYYVGEKL